MTPLGTTRHTVVLALMTALTLSAPGLVSPAQAASPARASDSSSGSSSGPDRGVRASKPLVIGHRGASGYRPEHTLASYKLAIRMGADYIEPDLVSTKDGVLVSRHENEISGTTDVAAHPEFAARRTTKTIDGKPITGWFTEDFTLAELRTLRAKERLPQVRPNNTQYDGRFLVPTFDEVLDLVNRTNRKRPGTARDIGVYPETKHPTYFASIGLALERPMLRELRNHGLDRKNAKVFLQSFETRNLRQLDKKTDLPLIQLMDATGAPYDLVAEGDPRTWADLTKPAGLRFIARYADGIGPNKDLVLPRDASNRVGAPSALVRDAHRQGLLVHVFTLRRENQFMAANFQQGTDPNAPGNMAAEVKAFLDAGIDGFFTDNSDIGVAARDAWVRSARKVA